MSKDLEFFYSGDSAFVVKFGDDISIEINQKIKKVTDSLKEKKINGLIEIVPTYCSLLISYNPCFISYEELKKNIMEIYNEPETDDKDSEVNLIEIPTLYNDEEGPDLEYVAQHNNLTKEEVIKIHTERDYLVYMLGFMPGFTYLGGMDERIATPRLESPRLQILPGSVGIAGKQTGMYPSLSPGGWRIIGRTPLKLYNPENDPPVYISSGDYIRYVSIDKEEYEEIEKEVNAGTYKIKVHKIKRGELNA